MLDPNPILTSQIGTLLSQLGLADSVCRVQGFWQVHAHRLDTVLQVAEQVYRRKRIACAPRLLTDPDEPVRALNELWMEIKRRFNQQMNPTFVIPKDKRETFVWQKMRVCQLATCSKEYLPNHPSQKYCNRICASRVDDMKRIKDPIDKVCDICMTPFKTQFPFEKRCSEKCKEIAKSMTWQRDGVRRRAKKNLLAKAA